MQPIVIRPAEEPDIETVRTLFREYAASLNTDLCFQNFEAELASLPGKYSPPKGRLLLACRGAEAIGCIALRPIDAADCEMKRLYVRPTARGVGLGRRMVERICQEAREGGYKRIRLDTLPAMAEAIRLYRSMSFQETPPYTYNPVPGTLFLALDL